MVLVNQKETCSLGDSSRLVHVVLNLKIKLVFDTLFLFFYGSMIIFVFGEISLKLWIILKWFQDSPYRCFDNFVTCLISSTFDMLETMLRSCNNSKTYLLEDYLLVVVGNLVHRQSSGSRSNLSFRIFRASGSPMDSKRSP